MGLSRSRIASLYGPQWPLQALLRAEPALRGKAVAVTDGGRVLCAAPQAAGICAGMTAAQARAVCPHLVVRPVAETYLQSATSALLDAAAAFSPLVEHTGDSVQMEIGDLARLFRSEEELGTAILAATRRLSLEVQVALAASSATARVLSRARPGVCVIPPGQERPVLAPLPLSALPLVGDEHETLHGWGLSTIGAFAALPRRRLAARLGARGAALHRLACGEDDTPLHPAQLVEPVSEVLELDDPLDNLEPLSFLLRGLLDRLVQRLALRSLACPGYTLRLVLCGEGLDERPIGVAVPTRDVAVLVELARVSLAARPPPAAVKQIIVRTTPAPRRPGQLSLLEPAGPAPEKLSTTLARLAALSGHPEGVGTPALIDSHLPSEVQMAPFAGVVSAQSAPSVGLQDRGPALGSHLCAHVLRPPRPAEVTLAGSLPAALQADLATGRIVRRGGPYRLRVGFGAPVLRDYYDVELEHGGLYRLFQDLATSSWFLDARYD